MMNDNNDDDPATNNNSDENAILIAQLAEAILAAPDMAFSKNNDSNKSKMQRLFSFTQVPQDSHTVQLALLSLLAVYCDIIPSYRIRLPTQQELAVRVTKEVHALRQFERALLTSYQQYLKWLGNQIAKMTSAPTPLQMSAVLALCELLKRASHFNFRSNLLTAVVKYVSHNCLEVRSNCCEALQELFTTDKQGEFTLEAVKALSTFIKNRHANVTASTVELFQYIPLRIHADEAEAAKLYTSVQKKKRRRNKEEADIEEEMKEGDAEIDKVVLARSQAETLHTVTLTYFRIIKSHVNVEDDDDNNNDNDKKEKKNKKMLEELLPVTMKGLSKITHLINIDTVHDLLEVLKKLLSKVDLLPLDAALNCVLAAFSTLNGPGRELQIDQKNFVTPLYTQLSRLCDGQNYQNTDTAIKCLTMAFLKRREYSMPRVAAFAKLLSSVSMHLPQSSATSLIAFNRLLFQRYQGIHQLLENEQDIVASGTYTPETTDPENANAFSTSIWELSTLKFHINPSVGSHAADCISLKPLQLPRESPENICGRMTKEERSLHIPYKRIKKEHPLAVSLRKSKRQQYRFVTPRETQQWHLL